MNRRLALGLVGSCLLLSLSLAPAHAAAQRVALTVDRGGAASVSVPVRGGVPLPKGACPRAENARLLADGKEAPLQARGLAFWPDGSVKWLLLDFAAEPGVDYQLEYGAQVSRAAVPSPLIATQNDAGATVWFGRLTTLSNVEGQTGALRLAVTTSADAGLALDISLDLDGDGQFSPQELVAASGERPTFLDFVHTEGEQAFVSHGHRLEGVLDPSTLRVSSVTLEQPGPLHAVVLIRGQYRNGKLGSTIPGLKAPGLSDFTLRLHLFRGFSFIVAQHSFTYEGDPDHDFVRQVGLAVRPKLAAGAAPVVTIGLGGEAQPATIRAGLCGIAQLTADSYQVWRAEGERVQVAASGQRAPGWLDLSASQMGVTVGLRDFWQTYAKSIIADPTVPEVRANSWAPEAGALDMRRYARTWGVGETGAQENRDIAGYSRFAAKGAAVTSEAVFLCHRGPWQAERDGLLMAALLARPVVVLPADYAAKTGALGPYRALDEAQFPELEHNIQNAIAYWLHSQELFRWYGLFDYGDFQQWYNTGHKHGRWDSDFGRWGWGNNDGMGRNSHLLMLQFLRTGQRCLFDAAAAMVRHNYEADMIHTREYPWDWGDLRDVSGCCHRHNAQHWGCPYIGLRGASPMGARIYYYLTGDERTADLLDLVLDASLKGRMGHSGGGSDGFGTAAYSYLLAWERTRQPVYADKLKALCASDMMQPKDTWEAVISTSFGLYHAIADYCDLTGDPQAKQAILRICDIVITNLKEDWTYPDGYFKIVADGYRLTGDQRYRERLEKMVARINDDCAREGQSLPRDQWPGLPNMPAPNLHTNALRDMPYVMEALSR